MSEGKAERVYIRFGDVPEGGRSANYNRAEPEEGLSVFVADRLRDDFYRLKDLNAHLAVMAGACLAIKRPLYEVEGTEIGNGADGEPLLADFEATPINRKVVVEAEGYERLCASVVAHASAFVAEFGPMGGPKHPPAKHPPRPSNADDLLTDDDPEALEAFEEFKSGLRAGKYLSDRRRRIEPPAGPSTRLTDLFARGLGDLFPVRGRSSYPAHLGQPVCLPSEDFPADGGIRRLQGRAYAVSPTN